jgi:hypothetical protein
MLLHVLDVAWAMLTNKNAAMSIVDHIKIWQTGNEAQNHEVKSLWLPISEVARRLQISGHV